MILLPGHKNGTNMPKTVFDVPINCWSKIGINEVPLSKGRSAIHQAGDSQTTFKFFLLGRHWFFYTIFENPFGSRLLLASRERFGKILHTLSSLEPTFWGIFLGSMKISLLLKTNPLSAVWLWKFTRSHYSYSFEEITAKISIEFNY